MKNIETGEKQKERKEESEKIGNYIDSLMLNIYNKRFKKKCKMYESKPQTGYR